MVSLYTKLLEILAQALDSISFIRETTLAGWDWNWDWDGDCITGTNVIVVCFVRIQSAAITKFHILAYLGSSNIKMLVVDLTMLEDDL